MRPGPQTANWEKERAERTSGGLEMTWTPVAEMAVRN